MKKFLKALLIAVAVLIVVAVAGVCAMFHGEIRGELVGDEMNEQAIMRLATGGEA